MSKTLLEELGREVWQRIADGERLGVRQGEVTLTDHVLLELRRRSGGSVKVWKIGPKYEPKTGADIDLWVRRGHKYRRLLIQAKRLDQDQQSYKHLGHKVGDERQADILDRAASILRAVPAYAFYNHVSPVQPHDCWHCCDSEELALYGWTIGRLQRVQEALNTRGCRTFEFIHQDSGACPVRCLVCPKLLGPQHRRMFSLRAWSGDVGWYDQLPIDPAADGAPPGWSEAAGYGLLDESERPGFAVILSEG